jgi:hypothetical protein
MHSVDTGGNGRNITARTNTTAEVTLPLITAGGNTDRVQWYIHQRWMVRRTGVDVLVITASWNAAPAMIGTSSLPDDVPARCRWLHLHRRMVCWPGVASYIITAGRYSRPALMDASSPPDSTPGRRQRTHYHCRMVHRAGGGKIPSPPYGTPD